MDKISISKTNEAGKIEEKQETIIFDQERASILGSLKKIYKHYEKEDAMLPQIVILPETSARPLYYAVQPVLENVSNLKKEPSPDYFFLNTGQMRGVLSGQFNQVHLIENSALKYPSEYSAEECMTDLKKDLDDSRYADVLNFYKIIHENSDLTEIQKDYLIKSLDSIKYTKSTDEFREITQYRIDNILDVSKSRSVMRERLLEIIQKEKQHNKSEIKKILIIDDYSTFYRASIIEMVKLIKDIVPECSLDIFVFVSSKGEYTKIQDTMIDSPDIQSLLENQDYRHFYRNAEGEIIDLIAIPDYAGKKSYLQEIIIGDIDEKKGGSAGFNYRNDIKESNEILKAMRLGVEKSKYDDSEKEPKKYVEKSSIASHDEMQKLRHEFTELSNEALSEIESYNVTK